MHNKRALDIVILDDDIMHARHLSRLASAHHLESSQIDPRHFTVGDAPMAQLAVIRSARATELVREFTETKPGTATIVLGGNDRADHVIACMRAGAHDVLPVDLADPESIARLRQHFTRCRNRQPLPQNETTVCSVGLAGQSTAIERIRTLIAQLGPTNTTCLIEGPTGAGKELVALGLHHSGKRSSGPLIAVNCGAIPDDLLEGELFGYEKGAFSGAINSYPGKLALAHGGTLFLDEIGELSHAGQVKLLRALESRQCYRLGGREPFTFDVRIVAATNRDLEQEVAAGSFRSDLYYRIAVARIPVPALTHRTDDVVPLAQHFIRQICEAEHKQVSQLSQCAVMALKTHHWPGNARELRNAMEVALIGSKGTTLYASDLALPQRTTKTNSSPHMPAIPDAISTRLTKSAINRALSDSDGNKSAAARILGCSRMTLYRQLRRG